MNCFGKTARHAERSGRDFSRRNAPLDRPVGVESPRADGKNYLIQGKSSISQIVAPSEASRICRRILLVLTGSKLAEKSAPIVVPLSTSRQPSSVGTWRVNRLPCVGRTPGSTSANRPERHSMLSVVRGWVTDAHVEPMRISSNR